MHRRAIYKSREFDNRMQAEAWVAEKEEAGWKVVAMRRLPVVNLIAVTVRKMRGRRHVAG